MRRSSDYRMEKMKPRGGGNRNSGHRSAVLFVGAATRGLRLSAPPPDSFFIVTFAV